MRRLLVTGGSGQVGSAVWQLATGQGFEVSAPSSSELDISKEESVRSWFTRQTPDIILNCAAYTAVDQAESELELAHAINADGPRFLAEAAGANVPIIHLSTDYVFDGKARDPYRETDTPSPLGVYGRTKLAGEQALMKSDARAVIIRTAWVYSATHPCFPRTMLHLARERDSLAVVQDQTGCPTHADDIAAALLAIASRFLSGPFKENWGGIYHFCSPPSATWYDFAKVIFDERERAIGRKVDLKAITTAEFPTAATRPAWSVLDCAKIARVFGIAAVNWEPRIRQTVRQILEQELRSS